MPHIRRMFGMTARFVLLRCNSTAYTFFVAVHHITSHHVTLRHVTSRHTTSPQLTPRCATSCYDTARHVTLRYTVRKAGCPSSSTSCSTTTVCLTSRLFTCYALLRQYMSNTISLSNIMPILSYLVRYFAWRAFCYL